MADIPDDVIEAMLDKFSPQFDWRNSKLPSRDECIRSMRAALLAADTAMLAHGWKRVPVEATKEISRAKGLATIFLNMTPYGWEQAYKIMVANAPAMYDAAPEVKS